MKQDTTVTIAFIFSLVSTLGVIINLFLTIKRDNKADQKDDYSLKEGIIKANMKLDQVCTTNNSILLEMDKLNDKVNSMALKQENHETRISILEGKHEKN
jgi:peptidoglycan hydrolase CwlO-like protein